MGIDKVSIVIDNYFDSECDVNTTIRQAYERGFRRCVSKYNLSNMRTSKLLEDENAKLRELLRDMWRFTGAACKKYPKLFDPSAQGGQMVQLNAIEAFEQRMRELRIEAKK